VQRPWQPTADGGAPSDGWGNVVSRRPWARSASRIGTLSATLGPLDIGRPRRAGMGKYGGGSMCGVQRRLVRVLAFQAENVLV
jgi:hypothetical protein